MTEYPLKFKLSNELIEILCIENIFYNYESLKKILNATLKTIGKTDKILPYRLQTYLKEDKIVNFLYLLKVIINHYIEPLSNLNYEYYSYYERPNYKNLTNNNV